MKEMIHGFTVSVPVLILQQFGSFDCQTEPIGVVLVSLLLILNIFYTLSSVSIVNFEQVNASWVVRRFSNEKKIKAWNVTIDRHTGARTSKFRKCVKIVQESLFLLTGSAVIVNAQGCN